jgi:hypothetical protein
MNPDRNSNLLALDALMKANIDAQTKAQLFQQSVCELQTSNTITDLSNHANQTLADLKYALSASLQQTSLFYS